jgi:hypothetical protein
MIADFLQGVNHFLFKTGSEWDLKGPVPVSQQSIRRPPAKSAINQQAVCAKLKAMAAVR